MFRKILITAMLALFAMPALAEDDFGARFSGQAPSALEDEAAAFGAMEPAAGEETTGQDNEATADEETYGTEDNAPVSAATAETPAPETQAETPAD